MIALRRIDHVSLRVADVDEAAARWAAQFGLTEVERRADRIRLACDDEPYALELIAGTPLGLDHVAYELAAGCSLEQARAHLIDAGAPLITDPTPGGAPAGGADDVGHTLHTQDPDGFGVELLPFRAAGDPRPAHARPAANPAPGHPRKLGHVNFLTADLPAQLAFYTETLGMAVTDWLGDGGVWLHVNADHHVMALIAQPAPPAPHFHHLAFDVVDIGALRVALDHLGRHGRWLAWGPTRHGVGGNIAAYVRIPEENCLVELYCDMEVLERGHVPRHWPDDRHASNTWGQLPPRSYFRFDAAAIASEAASLEALGIPLAPLSPDKETP